MVKNVVVFFWHFLKKCNIKDTKKMPKNAKKCQINYGNICEAKCCKYKKIHYITEPIFFKDTKKDTKDTIPNLFQLVISCLLLCRKMLLKYLKM